MYAIKYKNELKMLILFAPYIYTFSISSNFSSKRFIGWAGQRVKVWAGAGGGACTHFGFWRKVEIAPRFQIKMLLEKRQLVRVRDQVID